MPRRKISEYRAKTLLAETLGVTYRGVEVVRKEKMPALRNNQRYVVKVDQAIHAEVLERNKQFPSPPYSGFVNPLLVPEMNDAGEITAIKVTQPKGFSEQMLYYSKNYNHLPDVN